MPGIMKWLQDNPLGLALGALCGLLLFILLALTILSSLPLTLAPADDANGAADPGLNLPTLATTPPLDAYSVITQRPLFNETRLPVLDDAAGTEEPPEPGTDDKQPEVELAGVVITPSLRMVTLKRKDNALSLVAFEGQPIEGDFGSWQVSRIMPRAATLSSAGGEELQLEMKVHDAKIEPPAPVVDNKRAAAANAGDGAQEGSQAPLSRAEEIRQRIAERREELRLEAEQAGESGEPSYQQAIQSKIGRNRRNNPNNGNEQ